jgi:hypothetical protein
MTYQITFNGRKGFYQFKVSVKSIVELLHEIERLTYEFGEPFDMIYLIDGRP